MAKKTEKAPVKKAAKKAPAAKTAQKAPAKEKMKVEKTAKESKPEKVAKPKTVEQQSNSPSEKLAKAEKKATAAKEKAEKKAKEAAQKIITEENKKWFELKEKYGDEKASAYSMTQTYEAHTPILHKVLGWGYILSVQNDRLEVLFEQGSKILISNYKPN